MKINFKSFFIELLVIFLSIVFALLFLIFASDSINASRFMIILIAIISIFLLKRMLNKNLEYKNYAELAIIIGFIFWYIVPGVVNILINNEPVSYEINQSIDNQTILTVIASFAVFLFFWRISHFIFYRQKRPLKHYDKNLNVRRLEYISIIGCLVGLIPFFIGSNSLSQIFSSIFEGRAAEKVWLTTSNIGTEQSAYIAIINSFFYACLTLVWIIILKNKINKNNSTLLIVFALFLTTVIYFDQGTRSIFALLVLPFIILFLINKWDSIKNSKSGRIKFILGLLTLVFISFLLLQFQMIYRLIYSRTNLESLLFSNWLTLGGTSDFFSESAFAFALVPNIHDYFHESALLQFAVSPIPRFLWPTKPLSELVWYYSFQRSGLDIYVSGGNIFPGIIGYYYMSWGWLGIVFISFLSGFVSAKVDLFFLKINIKKDIFRAGLGIMFVVWLFLSFRNLSPGFLYPVLFAFLILKISKHLNQKHENV